VKTINTYYKDYLGLVEFVQQHQQLLVSQENTAILVQVFSGRYEAEFIERLTGEILAVLPLAYIVGTTASGVIMNGEVSGLNTVLSISVFQHAVLRGRSFHKVDQEDFQFGRHIAASLASVAAKALILFGTGNSFNVDQVLKGIEMETPRLLVIGGNAGTNSMMNPAFVFYNQDIVKCGLVGLVLEGDDLEAYLYSNLGWQAIGKEMTITEVKGSRVYTINNIPAYQVYQRYLGIDKIGNFLNVVEFPLILKRRGILTARTPMIYYKDDSIGFAGEFAEGEKVRLSFGDQGLIFEMIEKLCQEINQRAVEGIFVYSCESRRGFLQDFASIETRPLQKLAPTAGFFTAGEYYHSVGMNQLLNATMTVLVLAEQGDSLQKQGKMTCDGVGCTDTVYSLYQDSIAGRSSGVMKALAHLINTVTTELEQANKELYYIGLHDSLTGLYNRTFFEQGMKHLAKVDDSVGIIICDMDCLKLVNDTLGHEFGDRMLRLLASIMLESCREEDIVARIGGDEFAILVKGNAESEAEGICERIAAGAKKVRDLRKDNLLYLSVGFAFKEKKSAQSLSEVFKNADNAMYQYKLKYKDQVRNAIMKGLDQMNVDRP